MDDEMNWWNKETGRKREKPEKSQAYGVNPPQSPYSRIRGRTDNPYHQR